MKKVAMLLANGFEEIEALVTVDILRRANVSVDLVSMNAEHGVTGAHEVKITTDKLFEDMQHYDMIILPGGAGAWTNRDDSRVIELLKEYDKNNKFIAAICAAPMALGVAGIIKGKKVTCYPADDIIEYLEGAEYIEVDVCVDGNIITSRGPATTFDFAFKIAEALGVDVTAVKQGMLCDN